MRSHASLVLVRDTERKQTRVRTVVDVNARHIRAQHVTPPGGTHARESASKDYIHNMNVWQIGPYWWLAQLHLRLFLHHAKFPQAHTCAFIPSDRTKAPKKAAAPPCIPPSRISGPRHNLRQRASPIRSRFVTLLKGACAKKNPYIRKDILQTRTRSTVVNTHGSP
jgi:hypothetical protein